MDNNKVVARYKWDMDVIVTRHNDRPYTIHIASTDYMTEREIKEAGDLIAMHGVWQKGSLIPPHRVYEVAVHKTGEEKNVYQG